MMRKELCSTQVLLRLLKKVQAVGVDIEITSYIVKITYFTCFIKGAR
jgi:hypothetical protein